MSDKPLISVIIPTFNRATVLPRTVKLVLAQTYRPLQLILVNDGSRDHTADVMDTLKRQVVEAGIEPTFVNKVNGGCASARNEAFRHVRGEFFAFLDDDDEWLPQKISLQVAELQRTGADACCTQARKLITRGEIIQPGNPANLIVGCEPGKYIDGRADAHLITLMVATRLLALVGDFDPDLRTGSDTEWIARLCHHASFCAVPEILAVYTYSDDALSRVDSMEAEFRRDAMRMMGVERLKQKCGHLPNWDNAAWQRRAAKVYDQCVKHRLYAGDLAEARALFDKGMRIAGGAAPLPRVRAKMRRAWWLSLIGKRLKHPKLLQS